MGKDPNEKKKRPRNMRACTNLLSATNDKEIWKKIFILGPRERQVKPKRKQDFFSFFSLFLFICLLCYKRKGSSF
jgi:hypothetical protein